MQKRLHCRERKILSVSYFIFTSFRRRSNEKPTESGSLRVEYRNLASLTRNIVEGARKCARVMAFEIVKQSAGGTGKAIRTCAIAGYYEDVRGVSSIILIAKITAASTVPTNISSPPYQPFLTIIFL